MILGSGWNHDALKKTVFFLLKTAIGLMYTDLVLDILDPSKNLWETANPAKLCSCSKYFSYCLHPAHFLVVEFLKLRPPIAGFYPGKIS